MCREEIPPEALVRRDASQDVDQPGADIDAGRLARGDELVGDGGAHGRGMAPREEIVLAPLCWQCRYVGIIAYCIVSKLVSVLVHNIMYGILLQVLKWAGAIYDRNIIPNHGKSRGAYERPTSAGARVAPCEETGRRKRPTLTPNDSRPVIVYHHPFAVDECYHDGGTNGYRGHAV